MRLLLYMLRLESAHAEEAGYTIRGFADESQSDIVPLSSECSPLDDDAFLTFAARFR